MPQKLHSKKVAETQASPHNLTISYKSFILNVLTTSIPALLGEFTVPLRVCRFTLSRNYV